MSLDDVDFFSPHPAAISQMEAQMDAIGVGLEKTHVVTDVYGHSGAGSAFIILKEALKENKIKPGDTCSNLVTQLDSNGQECLCGGATRMISFKGGEKT